MKRTMHFDFRTATLAALISLHVGAMAQEVPANVKAALKQADAAVAAIVKVPKSQRNFENTLGALDEISVRLDNDTSLTIFMQYVHPDAKTRDSGRAAETAVTDWAIELSKNETLYKAVMEYASTKPKLSGEQKRLLDFTLRDYRRAGMGLSKVKRTRLIDLEKDMSRLGIEFDQNIAEDPLKVPLAKDELKGVPEAIFSRGISNGDVALYGLDGPTYSLVMDYCENPVTRQKMQWLYRRRGGEKNVGILEKLLVLRAEHAGLLGYANRVDYEIETRMAKNSKTVAAFYEKLRPVVEKKAQHDLAQFTEAKREHLGDSNAKLMPWDYSFYKRRLMATKYAVDSQKVSEYFPMDQVVKGLFDITSKLYGIEYKEIKSAQSRGKFPLWHADVKFYEVWDKPGKKLLGRLYTDLYPRPNKYTHAACWGLQPRRVWKDGSVQVPLAALVCNFTKPTADKPSLLPHDEVETFFHEFGHGLHQILTNTRYGRFSGTAVARDFVEAPSQMLENWVWAPEVLATFAKHYQTGQTLPAEVLEGMKSARTLGSGIETQGQFYLGLMDYRFHTAKGGKVDTTAVAQQTYEDCTVYDKIPGALYQASFGHLVGYQGAYYGYMWSLVYAQDMFQKFEELGLLSPEAGMYYRTKILGRGGSLDEDAMLRDYLGREPNMDAFMRHLGLDPGSERTSRP